jgi:hypothetical protein
MAFLFSMLALAHDVERLAHSELRRNLEEEGATIKKHCLYRVLLDEKPATFARSEFFGVTIDKTWRGGKEKLALLKGQRNLKEVNFHELSDEWLPILADLPQLEGVYLSGKAITDKGLMHIKKLEHLVAISLANTSITNKSLGYVSRMRNLRFLNLCLTDVTDEGLRYLLGLENLEVLLLDGTKTTRSGASVLKDMKKLRRLRLSNEHVEKKVGQSDAILDLPSELEKLDADGVAVKDDDMARIAKLGKLKWLSLGFTRITDRGLTHLVASTRLEYLRLDGTAITNSGVKHLRRVERLEHLDISFTAVSDASIPDFLAFKTLKTLVITGTEITVSGKKTLEQAKIRVVD